MYDKVRNACALYAQIEADTAIFVKAEFEDLAEQVHLVSLEQTIYAMHCNMAMLLLF